MYKGICKYNSSRFWDETSNMAKFTKLMETSFKTSCKPVSGPIVPLLRIKP